MQASPGSRGMGAERAMSAHCKEYQVGMAVHSVMQSIEEVTAYEIALDLSSQDLTDLELACARLERMLQTVRALERT